MKNHWLGTILIFLTLISCNKENTNIPKDDKRTVNQEVVNDLKNSAIELFKQTVASNDQNENILISPLSIQYATGMAINGAKGKTFDELLSVFNKHGQMDSINTSLNILMAKFNKNDEITVNISNGVFYDPNLLLMDVDYKIKLIDHYDAGIEELDFSEKTKSLQAINGWVYDKTNHLIEKVLDNIQQEEIMFLINTLYLKANWMNTFDTLQTIDDYIFKDSRNIEHNVSLMNQQSNLKRYHGNEEKAVVLPLADDQLEAVFILPNEMKVMDYIASMNSSKIENIIKNATLDYIMIGLPKFKIEGRYDIKKIMSIMGIYTPFGDQADFTKMGNANANIYLSRILHNTYMEIDEAGIEGAAVTTIGVGTTSVPEYFGFTRPFVFAVYDKESGVFLFIGKIEIPKWTEN